MIPELANFSLILALLFATVQSIFPLLGAWRGDARLTALARPAARGQFLFVTLAFAALVYCLVRDDFSVSYVAENSNSHLPWYFRVAASWGGHEGSLLLWVQILALWTLAVSHFSQKLPEQTIARVLGVMGLISVGFLGFSLLTSNPFARHFPVPLDGRDLNPLLQDWGMIIHPPLLYMGYVGFSVAFAFALAALMSGQLDVTWARWSRPWTLVAWMFQTLGIFLGSFWAYYELGWGGWWFWDAVENASFMPWLIGTALIHSLAVSEKRGSFKSWTVLLAITAFSLSLLGTFLVRSGVLSSVHAFASDPRRGLYILIFLSLVIGGSLGLYAWRAPQIGLGGSFGLFSRESLLLMNNLLFAVVAATVLLGTLYPLLLDALNLAKISVGPPYFETVFLPLMLPVLLLTGIGPLLSWKDAKIWRLLWQVRWLIALSILFAILSLLIWGLSWTASLGLGLAIWIVLCTGLELYKRLSHAGTNTRLLRRVTAMPLSYWGMLVAHAGIAVFVVGVTMVKAGEVSQDAAMRLGDKLVAGGYTFRMTELRKIEGPNYLAAQARFEVNRGQDIVSVLTPQRRMYLVQKTPMTIAAIDRGFTRDLYVSLGEANKDGSWVVRAQLKPFVSWIWSGCLIIALGGLLAASDRRYRHAKRSVSDLLPLAGKTSQAGVVT